MIRVLELSVPFLTSGEERRAGNEVKSRMVDDLINYVYVIKLPKEQGSESFWVGDQVKVLVEWNVRGHGSP